MVEYAINLDFVFHCLADPTRRDILRRLCERELSVSELATKYDMSFAAVAKHLNILERAKLIVKRRQGKERIAVASPETISIASEHLRRYEQIWDDRFNNLESSLNKEAKNE